MVLIMKTGDEIKRDRRSGAKGQLIGGNDFQVGRTMSEEILRRVGRQGARKRKSVLVAYPFANSSAFVILSSFEMNRLMEDSSCGIGLA